MTTTTVQWCENVTHSRIFSSNIDQLANTISNLAYVVCPLIQYICYNGRTKWFPFTSNIVLIGVGVSSTLFHSQNTFSSQLADELGMSLLAYTYLQITNRKYNNNLTLIKWKKLYPYIVSSSLILYICIKWYPLFVTTFLFQLSIPIYDTLFHLHKKNHNYYFLYGAMFSITVTKGCWIWERYLYETNRCPTNMFIPLFYLHSFWHIGTALSHTLFLQHLIEEDI